jgi:hypothetical protein
VFTLPWYYLASQTILFGDGDEKGHFNFKLGDSVFQSINSLELRFIMSKTTLNLGSNSDADANNQDFFGVPIEFFQTKPEFQTLLAQLQTVNGLIDKSIIEVTPPFKEGLTKIRQAFKESQDSEAIKAQKAEEERILNEVVVAVIKRTQNLDTVKNPGEIRKRIADLASIGDSEASALAIQLGLEFGQIASVRIANLSEDVSILVKTLSEMQTQQALALAEQANQLKTFAEKNTAKQEEILGGQQTLSTKVDWVLEDLKVGQRQIELQSLVMRNSALIEAEVEIRLDQYSRWDRLRGGKKLYLQVSQKVNDEAFEIAELIKANQLERFSFKEFKAFRARTQTR